MLSRMRHSLLLVIIIGTSLTLLILYNYYDSVSLGSMFDSTTEGTWQDIDVDELLQQVQQADADSEHKDKGYYVRTVIQP